MSTHLLFGRLPQACVHMHVPWVFAVGFTRMSSEAAAAVPAAQPDKLGFFLNVQLHPPPRLQHQQRLAPTMHTGSVVSGTPSIL